MSEENNFTRLEEATKRYFNKNNDSESRSMFQVRKGIARQLYWDMLLQFCISQFEAIIEEDGIDRSYAYEGAETMQVYGQVVPFGYNSKGDLQQFGPFTNKDPLLFTPSGSFAGIEIQDPVDKSKKLKLINPKTGEGDFVLLSNKNLGSLIPFDGHLGVMNAPFARINYTFLSDIPLIDFYCTEMANVMATKLANSDQMRKPFIIASADNNMTSQLMATKFIEGGDQTIAVDSREDINNLITVLDLNIQDFTGSLSTTQESLLGEFLMQRGSFFDDNDKGERMLAREAGAGAQSIFTLNQSRLKPRQVAFKILEDSKIGKEKGLKCTIQNASTAFGVLAMETAVPDVDPGVGDGTAEIRAEDVREQAKKSQSKTGNINR